MRSRCTERYPKIYKLSQRRLYYVGVLDEDTTVLASLVGMGGQLGTLQLR
jgi:hypothetical protein